MIVYNYPDYLYNNWILFYFEFSFHFNFHFFPSRIRLVFKVHITIKTYNYLFLLKHITFIINNCLEIFSLQKTSYFSSNLV